MIKDKVIAVLSEPNEDQDAERFDLIAKTKAKEEGLLKELLLALNPEEIGGRIAIAGFYYQFLVAIEYMIELLEGKWDFVCLELHDDIVVGKGQHIKFIQVKSSQDTDKKVSETGIYSRSLKEVNGTKLRKADSWVDKLLLKSRYFPKSEGFFTEFELITSYVIIKTNEIDISGYRKKDHVPDEDTLLRKLSEAIYDPVTQEELKYLDLCGEQLSDLLSRFSIHKKDDLLRVNHYVNDILYQLGNKIGPGIQIDLNDFYWLMGLLMSKCQEIGNNLILFIEAQEAEEIRQLLHDRALQTVGETVRAHNSISIIHNVFDHMLLEIQDIDLYQDIESELYEYKNHLISWVETGGTIRNLMNRYLDGKDISPKYFQISEIDKTNKLVELFNTTLLLILIHEQLITMSEKHSSLLVKNLHEEFISFLGLNRGDNIDKAVSKIQELFQDHTKSLDVILYPPSMVVLLGRFAGNNGNGRIVTVSENRPDFQGFPQGDSLKDMKVYIKMLPGGQLSDQYQNLFQFESMHELRQHLKEFWTQFTGE